MTKKRRSFASALFLFAFEVKRVFVLDDGDVLEDK